MVGAWPPQALVENGLNEMKEFHQEVQQRMAHALVGGTPAHSGASQGATSSRQVPSLTLPFSA